MPQNIYDDPEFFAEYSRLRRSRHGLDGAPEWPAVRELLPDLTGKRVVDLGCGFGWFSRWARENGAEQVVGYDLSHNMLQRARQDTPDEGVEYVLANLESLELPVASFDLAYSSLALHYIEDLARLVRTVYRALTPGGRFVFTMEHPIFTAPASPEWVRGPDGRKGWRLTQYAVEGERTPHWLGADVVKYHRTMGTILQALIDAGFRLQAVRDWSPAEKQLEELPLLSEELERPMILIVSAARE